MNIDEIALRVAHMGMLGDRDASTFTKERIIDFAHCLLAELAKDAEPVGYLDTLEARMPEFHYKNNSHGDMVPVFLHPAVERCAVPDLDDDSTCPEMTKAEQAAFERGLALGQRAWKAAAPKP